MESLTNPLWITYHQTPVHFKANKVRVRKKVTSELMKTESPPRGMQVQLHPGPELPRVSALVSGSGPSTLSFILGILPRHVLSSPTCASREAVSARQRELARAQVVDRPWPWAQNYHSLTIWQLHRTGEHLRCAATARSEYFQKDLISFPRCLQNCFAYILTQLPLKAKHSLPPGEELVRPVTSSYICSNGHITQNNLAVEVSVQD